MSRKELVYLVVGSDGTVRAARKPRIAMDEVAIALTLHFPDGWGRVTQTFEIEMPEPPVVAEPVVESRDD